MSKKSISTKRLDAANTDAASPAGQRFIEPYRQYTFNPADFVVQGLETPEFIAKLREELIALYRPADSQELFAVERIVMAQLSLRRCAALEDGLFSSRERSPQDVNFRLAQGFRRIVGESSVWPIFLRYHKQSDDSYQHALQFLQHLQASRRKLARKIRPQITESMPVTIQ